MFKHKYSLGVAGLTVLLSLLLFSLGIAAGVYLYFQQADTAEELSENVDSRRVARELEITLQDLVALLRDNNDRPEALHERVNELLASARELADKDRERELVGQLEVNFSHYRQTWRPRSTPGAAIAILETQMLPACRELREYNARQIEDSEAAHRQTLEWVAWGLGGVGVLGSVAGLFLGYGLARRLRRSIYQLSVSVRDAANRLGQELPTVTLSNPGDLHDVHRQLKGLLPEIEQVVGRLQQREREVLRAEQMAAVGQLAAGVAHELRNPLTSIKMLVQASREEAEARGLQAEDLFIIEQEIRRMERCLQNFLDFARPPKLRRRPLDLRGVVERTLALIAGRARKQRVLVEFTPPPAPLVVAGDAEQLQQLVVNLALNALDSMPHGGTLRVDLCRGPDGHAELRVIDTGPGIAPDLLPRLFQPFVSTKETGLGMGLVVSQRIAGEHAGSLRAENRTSGGACFTLRLPPADIESGIAIGAAPAGEALCRPCS